MQLPRNTRRMPTWFQAVTWIAILAPLPYSVSRLTWAAGLPIGIEESLLRDFQSPGWGSLYILCLAALPELTAIFTHRFLMFGASTAPARLPLVGGRRVPPRVVVGALLIPISILAGFNLWSLGPIADGFAIPESNDGLTGWSFWGQVATFWVWGLALSIATAGYWLATRSSNRAPSRDV